MSKTTELRELLNLTFLRAGQSKLTRDQIDPVGGLSSPNIRHLLNNLGAISHDYYEVGTHLGCSLVSTGFGNEHLKSLIGCDNFSQLFNNPEAQVRSDCFNNLNRFLPDRYKVLEKDFLEVTKDDLPNPIDLFFYDGSHDYDSQRKAITHNVQFFDKECIVLVDDMNYEEPNYGTMQGIKDSGVTIKYCSTMYSGIVGDCGEHGFWNGLGVFLIEK